MKEINHWQCQCEVASVLSSSAACVCSDADGSGTSPDISRSSCPGPSQGIQKTPVLSSVSLKAAEIFTCQPPTRLAVSLSDRDRPFHKLPLLEATNITGEKQCDSWLYPVLVLRALQGLHAAWRSHPSQLISDGDSFKFSLLPLDFHFFNTPASLFLFFLLPNPWLSQAPSRFPCLPTPSSHPLSFGPVAVSQDTVLPHRQADHLRCMLWWLGPPKS